MQSTHQSMSFGLSMTRPQNAAEPDVLREWLACLVKEAAQVNERLATLSGDEAAATNGATVKGCAPEDFSFSYLVTMNGIQFV
jgi:hypothetical protein